MRKRVPYDLARVVASGFKERVCTSLGKKNNLKEFQIHSPLPFFLGEVMTSPGHSTR